MASSDDEAVGLPQLVSNYYFEDDKDEPISFSVLPIQWREGESEEGDKQQIFLHGTTDNGLQKIYKHVIAWRFDLSNVSPEISVLSKQNNWIKLQKPRKSFENVIRTILITVHCLHFMKKNPEASGKSLWDHLSRVFSLYEVRPSQNDLVDHMPLICEAVSRDDTLAKAKFLCTFLKEKPGKRKLTDETVPMKAMSQFIVDDIDDDILDEEDDSNEDEEVYDAVCAFCDNGGDILCCDGRCMRSFHATVEAGAESKCFSLGLFQKEVDDCLSFLCKNCEYNQHQCFACGKLGSSDKFSGAEVFCCVNATCGYFYHPRCVAKLLHEENEVAAGELEKKISAGGSFTCPIHKCCVCKQGENKKDRQLQFAVCRRCPKSYHRKCLPREIAFEDMEDEDIMQRAWEDLLPNRILIYCLKHEIDEIIGTPIRDHIRFPDVITTVEKKRATLEEKKKQAPEFLVNKEKDLLQKKNIAVDGTSCGRSSLKVAKQNQKSSSNVKAGNITNSQKMVSVLDISKRRKIYGTSRKVLDKKAKSVSMKAGQCDTADENKSSLGDMLHDLMKGPGQVKPMNQDTPIGKDNKTLAVKPATKKPSSELPSLDADSERRLVTLMRDAASAITLEEIRAKYKVPSSHAYSSKNYVDKNITLGKLEGSVEAIRAALGKLEEGCSPEDAEAVCEPDILRQIYKWKNKLKVYLSPFLNGNRYTSYGRHFTKIEKLEEIVNKLHCYVQNGDMIVDFCCGANDFSILMKKKLEETEKKCLYKNYDVFQAKNNFNFEKRDWMTVQPRELPTGSRLIMGLNPPFGVRASLANQFVDKALEFNPKLLVLIVPHETQRLDEKKTPYDLVWEEKQFLSGKSFYLPGSVDENGKQMDQWNLRAPPLTLWSRHDWTAKHKTIAEKHGHLCIQHEGSDTENNPPKNGNHDPMDGHETTGNTSLLIDVLPSESERPENFSGGVVVTKCSKESSSCSKGDKESLDGEGHGKNRPNETSVRKRKRDKQKAGKGMGLISSENKMDGGRPRSSPNVANRRSSLEHSQSKSREMPSHIEIGEDVHQHFGPSISGSHMQFAETFGGSQVSTLDELGRMYDRRVDEHYSRDIHRWSMDVGTGSDYRGTQVEEQLCMKERRESNDNDQYFISLEERLTREIDIRSQVRRYGQQDPDQPRNSYLIGQPRNSYLIGRDPPYGQIRSMPSAYGHLGPATDLSYRMNMPVMQRYAPRLDELNYTRPMNTLAYPPTMNVNSFYNPRASQPGYQDGQMGFAPGPRPAYPHKSSAGWLNE